MVKQRSWLYTVLCLMFFVITGLIILASIFLSVDNSMRIALFITSLFFFVIGISYFNLTTLDQRDK